jgi:hypothetical protein
MSGRLTFICIFEASLGLSYVPSARHLPLRLFISKWAARWSPFSASRLEFGAVSQLLCEAGTACSDYQDKVFRNLKCRLLQTDEARMPTTRVTGNGSLPLFEIARVLVHSNRFACLIANANNNVM